MNKKYKFHAHGMHCNACVLMIESELHDLPNISNAKSSLKDHSVEIFGEFGDKSDIIIAEELSIVLSRHGYTLSLEKQIKETKWSDFRIALPIAISFIALFIILQKIGIVNLINSSNMGYSTAFIIGIIASLSTCMAVVGGLVLSMSATFAKDGDRVKPQILFHIGRLLSFLILGGVIGAIGSAFALNSIMTFILGFIIGIVMLIMGINLLDTFHWAKKLQIRTPKFISKHALGMSRFNHTFTPFLFGIATFFLPCGFTQSMQIYTLGTGNFISGALTMFAFALGTLPVLALLSFSSFSINKSSKAGIFFKTAGLIVIAFAIFNLINSMAAIGIIRPLFNF